MYRRDVEVLNSHNLIILQLTDCAYDLGMKSGAIPNAAITASSEFGPFKAMYGRLDLKTGNGHVGAWSALNLIANNWLQVDLGWKHNISHVATQGREDRDEWVKSYTLSYSQDDVTFVEYSDQQDSAVNCL